MTFSLNYARSLSSRNYNQHISIVLRGKNSPEISNCLNTSWGRSFLTDVFKHTDKQMAAKSVTFPL